VYDVDIYFYPCDAKIDYSIQFTDWRQFRSDPRDQALGSDGNGMCQSMLNGVDIEYNGLRAGILGGASFTRRESYSSLRARIDNFLVLSHSAVAQEQGCPVPCRVRSEQHWRDHWYHSPFLTPARANASYPHIFLSTRRLLGSISVLFQFRQTPGFLLSSLHAHTCPYFLLAVSSRVLKVML
jgi:hypothetical protein